MRKSVWIIGLFALIAVAAALMLTRPQAVSAQDQSVAVAGAQADSGHGVPSAAGAPRQVVLADLPQATLQELARAPRPGRPRNGMTDEEWGNRVVRLGGKRSGPSMVEPGVVPAAPALAANSPVETIVDEGGVSTPTATKNFDGLPEIGTLTPADMGLAVGTTYIVQTVNVSITVLDKNGVVQLGFPKSLNTFFGLPADAFTFDPRAVFDSYRSRFIVIAETVNFAVPNSTLHVAVSATSSPLGVWYIYHLPGAFAQGAGKCIDFPQLGQDREAIIVSMNNFNCTTLGFGAFFNAEVYLLPKSPMYSGLGFSYWAQWGFNLGGVMLDTVHPVNVLPDTPRAAFMVGSKNINFGGGQCLTGCSGLIVWAIANKFAPSWTPSPKFTGIVVPTGTYYLSLGAHAPPFGAPPPYGSGGNWKIDAGDVRVSGMPTFRAGSIFLSLTTAVLGSGDETLSCSTTGKCEQSHPYWWELTPHLDDNGASGGTCTGSYLNKCPALTSVDVRQQELFPSGVWPSNGCGYYGALQPDSQKNVTMVYSYSSSALPYYPGLAYTSRRVTQANNTMHDTGWMLMLGSGLYSQGCWYPGAPSGNYWTGYSCRWGDYNGVAADAASSAVSYMWFSGMYVGSTPATLGFNWKTRIGRNYFATVTQP